MKKALLLVLMFLQAGCSSGSASHEVPYTQKLFTDETITRIAHAHRKTPAQIILRWHVQAGYIVIPGYKNPDHIRENINIFDFALSDSEMNDIAALNQNRRFENW